MIRRVLPAILLTVVLLAVVSGVPAHYTPKPGDYFTYYEVENLGNGTGDYQGYTEHTVVTGTETMNSVNSSGVVSAYYHYSWVYSNSTGQTQSGVSSGNFTFSDSSYLYINGTDNQTGYVNPTVWFYMNDVVQNGSSFFILNTQMTVISTDYSYHLPTQNKNVRSIFTQGKSSYHRSDSYGNFNAQYTWNSYFDPTTGYIIGYAYTEHDTNASGSGFTYSDFLYVNSTSYSLTTSSGNIPNQNGGFGYLEIGLIVVLILVMLVVVLITVFRKRKQSIPKHSQQPGSTAGGYQSPPPAGPAQTVNLTPKQPPVQQIVVKEIVKVKCSYCGALIDSTAQNCPECGAPRT